MLLPMLAVITTAEVPIKVLSGGTSVPLIEGVGSGSLESPVLSENTVAIRTSLSAALDEEN